ncbi:MAG TPA: phytoene desaturase family protein [Pyrinomonadaceae bacterium]|nr:phytoene desaturase family protein [Pyrinomonadaceae bacterium]
MKRKSAVVIGGGLGGLATALRLARANWRVTVCEQSPTLGGKMNAWEQGGFRFDTGPSLITMRWVFEELFEAVGSALSDHLELVSMHPLAEYVFDDGTRFHYSSDLPDWLATLRRLDARDVDGFFRFMLLGARLFEVSRETFFRRPPSSAPDLRSFKALRHMPLRYAWGNYHRTVAAHFKSPYLRQLFDRYPTYVGSSPYRSPATLAVIPYVEYAYGGWHIRGGLYRLVESLAALAERAGVTLRTGARVERIEHDGRKIKGVQLADGARLSADAVVMNGDASTTNAMLGLKRDATVAPEETRSLSGLVFLVGVRRTLPQLPHHAVYFSQDYRHEFAQLFDERRFPDDPTVYVSAPSRSDRALVPESAGETLFIMANAPANDGDEWTEAKINEARARVFARLAKGGFPDIESDTVVADVWTPRRIRETYSMPGGAIYGTNSHGWRRAFLRPPNRDARFAGLYYVGGSSHPGGGTPTVLLSAKITCELIKRCES